jgi:hypothetical protein
MSETSDMATTKPTPRTASEDLAPPDYAAIEPLYCGGVVSVNAISKKFGVSRPAIEKHARKMGWTRATRPQILARANELVATAPSPGVVAIQAPVTETEREKAITLGAAAVAVVLMNQRKTIERTRAVGERLLAELEGVIDRPELAHMVYDALAAEGVGNKGAMSELAHFITSLPERARVLKALTDTLGVAISMERTSYGLNTKEGEDGETVAIVKDYTGTGDEDSPGFDTDRQEEA